MFYTSKSEQDQFRSVSSIAARNDLEGKNRGQFHKAQTPKFVIQNAKIFKAFTMFNFIKALMPKFSQHNDKNDGVFQVQFHNTNLALKIPTWVTVTPKWATKMLKLATSCIIFATKNRRF